jgi:hypothetical protein
MAGLINRQRCTFEAFEILRNHQGIRKVKQAQPSLELRLSLFTNSDRFYAPPNCTLGTSIPNAVAKSC